ncbi:ABC transporter ATP-binding protein [Anaerotruncus colihominis]|uniref:ABC transporter ATP-binding protein n=1 Tax=Anaerotruncus colihominis TaxID=169435 RepID=A0A845RJ72_9FIRM|nr:ABC transporter ATP-binding protein [Anaerotruncus colihominis]NBI80120.1 ABC transporter ATP-binding protein [Anaerotruncus colihominis]
MESAVITVDNVSMMFNLSTERVDNIKEYVVRLVRGDLMFREFWALRNLSFQVKKGRSLGVIGLNGSGKSTLLKVVSGVLKPTSGTVCTYGSVAPLIELGAGFDSDLSARENIFLNGAILGYSRDYMRERFDEIVSFAELWDFIDVPIKNFSSGMIARLGFAIATMNVPEILIVDEVLSVGDYKFQEKSFARMQKILDCGATVMFVSHSTSQVRKLCDDALWLEQGELKMIGDVNTVCDAYESQ